MGNGASQFSNVLSAKSPLEQGEPQAALDSSSESDGSVVPAYNANKFEGLNPRQVFMKYDRDNNGDVDLIEFHGMLKSLGIVTSQEIARKFFKKCDHAGRDLLSLEQFEHALFTGSLAIGGFNFTPTKRLSPKDCYELFDSDEDGFIDRNEFSDILMFMNLKIPDKKQELLFIKEESLEKGNGMINYEGFRRLWLQLCDVYFELDNRKLQYSKKTPLWMLVKKLDQAVLNEVNSESRIHGEKQWWKKWESARALRYRLTANAKAMANDLLTEALDAGGQVYAFGSGSSEQFNGTASEPTKAEFENFGKVYNLWRNRVMPPPATTPHSSNSNQDRTIVAPFSKLQVSTNTVYLWGRCISEVVCGGGVAYAKTDMGHLYCWGGNKLRWHYIYNNSKVKKKGIPCENMVTPRSELLKLTTKSYRKQEATDKKANKLKKKHKNYGKIDFLYKDARSAASGIILICKYYNITDAQQFDNSEAYEVVTATLSSKIVVDFMRLSLQLRGIRALGMNKTELTYELGEALTLERHHFGPEFHVAMKVLDGQARELFVEKNHVGTAKLVQRGKRLWENLRILQNRLVSDDVKHVNSSKQKHKNDRELVFADKAYHSLKNLEAKNNHLSNSPIVMSGITSRGPSKKQHAGDETIHQISVGSRHAIAIHGSGKLYTWGVSTFGRLGIDTSKSDGAHPTAVHSLAKKRFRYASCGYSHSAAVTTEGDIYVWGSAALGKLGIDIPTEGECFCVAPILLKLPCRSNIRKVSCGASHTAILTAEGEMFVWGCADGGRLGIEISPACSGKSAKSNFNKRRGTNFILTPQRVERLSSEKVVDVSCGVAHTAAITCIQTIQGVITGGLLFVAGSAFALGHYLPKFHQLDELRSVPIRKVSCGNSQTACISNLGELYTFGNNTGGCTGHEAKYRSIRHPTVVKCLYEQSGNVAIGKIVSQSSIYNSQVPEIAINGKVNGDTEDNCIQTLREDNPFWQVDLERLCLVEKIVVWNRVEKCTQKSKSQDMFRDRLFPCYLFASELPFPVAGTAQSFREARGQSIYQRFDTPSDCIVWELPSRTNVQFVRLQLAQSDILHVAEIQIFGSYGELRQKPKASDVFCGENVTIAVCRERVTSAELERRYINAVCADSGNMHILREFDIYANAYRKYGKCRSQRLRCALCSKLSRCDVCLLLDLFPRTKQTEDMRENATLEELCNQLLEDDYLESTLDNDDDGTNDIKDLLEKAPILEPPNQSLELQKTAKGVMKKLKFGRRKSKYLPKVMPSG